MSKRNSVDSDESTENINRILFPDKLRVAYKEDEFLMNFYGTEVDFDEDSEKEEGYNIVIPKEALKDIILDLIRIGMSYQKEFNTDIGLPTKDK